MSSPDDIIQPKLIVQCSVSLEEAVQYFHQHKDGSVKLEFRKGAPSNSASKPLSDELLQGLLDAVATTRVKISHVSINPAFVEGFASDLKQIQFYRGVGGIGGLESVRWNVNRPDRTTSCLQPLTHLLDAARSLTSLDCHCAFFAGQESEFSMLANALQYHPKLRRLKFLDCRLHTPNIANSCIHPVLVAMGTISKLESLELSCWVPDLSKADPEDNRLFVPVFRALAQLCHRPYLDTLHLENSLGNGECLQITLKALKQSRNIRSLAVPIALKQEDCTLLADVIRTNQVLSSLSVRITNAKQDLDDKSIHKIISALETNSTITKLHFDCISGEGALVPSKDARGAILALLKTKNTSLTQLDFLVPPSLTPEDWIPFLDRLQFYLALNKLGRKELLENPQAKKRLWVDALVHALKYKHDAASLLMYILLQNPSLCDLEISTDRLTDPDAASNSKKEFGGEEAPTAKVKRDAESNNNKEESPTKKTKTDNNKEEPPAKTDPAKEEET